MVKPSPRTTTAQSSAPEGPGQLAESRQDLDLRLERVDRERAILYLQGRLSLTDTERLREQVEVARAEVGRGSGELILDLSGLETLEGGGAAMLAALSDPSRDAGVPITLCGAKPEATALMELYATRDFEARRAWAGQEAGLLERIGEATTTLIREGFGVLSFLGQLTFSLLSLAKRPRNARWRDVPGLVQRTGADGVPITLLINFLIGLIIALQSALQMRRFGAEVFVADLVGLSITRELGPLMTAILVAGRSGAAFAAELGTMKVNEEIDALRALRIDPMTQLVVPRIVALVLVMPCLTLLGDLVGIGGGMVVADLSMNIGWGSYLGRVAGAVGLSDIGVGLLKSVAFAGMIALVACQAGLSTRGGATGVGRSTTSAVVTILFALIVLDALFTALFTFLGV